MQQIKVTIGTKGETLVEADGVAGPGCTRLTEALRQRLGQTVADVKKPEFMQQSAVSNQVSARG